MIKGFRGNSFPNWVGDSSYSNLVSLVLRGCKYCTYLPPVGQLPLLETLWINGFHSVVSVGAEFYGGSCKSIQPFQSLKRLDISHMPRWEEWISDDPSHGERQGRSRAFPVLEHLGLDSCRELSRVNHLFLPSLIELELRICPNVTFPIDLSLPSLAELTLINCPGQELLQLGASTIRKLSIGYCSSLLLYWGLDKLCSLSSLKLVGIKDVECFPGRISLPSSLTGITISDLRNLKSLDYNGLHHLTSLKQLSILSCRKLQCIPEEGLPSSLSFLEIHRCPVLQRRCQPGAGEDWPKISRIPQIDIPPPETDFDPDAEVHSLVYQTRSLLSSDWRGHLQFVHRTLAELAVTFKE
ncbi:hypothetical protein Tsubulata_006575 [Turnera subulata]|uniref:R13L1/DRL21-like LRR repeat region domain-containing protein n=1 Tax=Turnera subulata TaxID=218843 RepID=A0A9Q0FZU2_9ROSI|nr:hypothetical protein Tsubulata_006575 [Turnera subulata]